MRLLTSAHDRGDLHDTPRRNRCISGPSNAAGVARAAAASSLQINVRRDWQSVRGAGTTAVGVTDGPLVGRRGWCGEIGHTWTQPLLSIGADPLRQSTQQKRWEPQHAPRDSPHGSRLNCETVQELLMGRPS
jgi:hypothetical protein